MLVYYPGFGPGANPYDLGLYPRTTNTLRLKIRRPSFLQYAEYNAGLLPPLPPTAAQGPEDPLTPPPTGLKRVYMSRSRPVDLFEAGTEEANSRPACGVLLRLGSHVQRTTCQPAANAALFALAV